MFFSKPKFDGDFFDANASTRILIPYLRRNRFWEATRINTHVVFPLSPGDDLGIPSQPDQFVDQQTQDANIAFLDESDADVGFLTGAINEVTVVEVANPDGQEWMDYLELEPGAQIWTPTARFYLFDYLEPTALPETRRPFTGLRIVNDGEWIPYPGSLIDGDLVHWENDPWAFGTHPLPADYWNAFL